MMPDCTCKVHLQGHSKIFRHDSIKTEKLTLPSMPVFILLPLAGIHLSSVANYPVKKDSVRVYWEDPIVFQHTTVVCFLQGFDNCFASSLYFFQAK